MSRRRPVVVRELKPQDLKLEVDQFSRREAVVAARYLAYVVGVSHARQMDEAARAERRRELAGRRSALAKGRFWSFAKRTALI